MDSSTSVALASIAMIGTILGLVVTPLFSLLRNNTAAQNKATHAMEKIAAATEKGSREAKERNGHLGEQNIQIATLVAQGNNYTKQVLTTLKDSANILVHNEEDKASAVMTVKTDLAATNQ